MSADTPAARRKSFASTLSNAGVRQAVISNPKHVFYFTGLSSNLNLYRAAGKGQRSTSFVSIGSEGEFSMLVGRSECALLGLKEGDEGISLYTDYDLDVTMLSYAPDVASAMKKWLQDVLIAKGDAAHGKVGVEDWHLADIYRQTVSVASGQSDLVGISPQVMEMRKTKGKDELENIRLASKMLDYAYGFAKDAAKVGRTELELFGELNRACLEKFGELGLVGGDIVSGERTLAIGGAASKRKLKKGDTVLLDLQTISDNYWSDTARTFVVGRPTAAQRKSLETIMAAKEMASKMLKPGIPTADVAGAIDTFLVKAGHAPLTHHAGHAVGLEDQERPWLIRGSKDNVQENQAYVIEPGIYEKETGGMRVEDCYIVTASGRERVSRFPLEF